MTGQIVAGIWLVVGLIAAVAPRWLRPFRWGAFLPAIIGAASLLAVTAGTNPGPLVNGPWWLDREASGLLCAVGMACTLILLLTPRFSGRELVTMGISGSAGVVILSATSLLMVGLAALVAALLISIRWISIYPNRATLAAGRVPTFAAAMIIGASAFLPFTGDTSGGRPIFVAAMLMVALTAILALQPAGGWLAGSLAALDVGELSAWVSILLPVLLLATFRISTSLSGDARLLFDHGLLITGLASGVWGGLLSITTRSGQRYGRVMLADLALVAAGIGSGQAAGIAGGLLLIMLHLCLSPLLLQVDRSPLRKPWLIAWVSLTGLPPTPAFWGRFLVLEGCAEFSYQAGLVCLVIAGLLFVVAVQTLVGQKPSQRESVTVGWQQQLVAWVVPIAALAIGMVPMLASQFLFGTG